MGIKRAANSKQLGHEVLKTAKAKLDIGRNSQPSSGKRMPTCLWATKSGAYRGTHGRLLILLLDRNLVDMRQCGVVGDVEIQNSVFSQKFIGSKTVTFRKHVILSGIG